MADKATFTCTQDQTSDKKLDYDPMSDCMYHLYPTNITSQSVDTEKSTAMVSVSSRLLIRELCEDVAVVTLAWAIMKRKKRNRDAGE